MIFYWYIICEDFFSHISLPNPQTWTHTSHFSTACFWTETQPTWGHWRVFVFPLNWAVKSDFIDMLAMQRQRTWRKYFTIFRDDKSEQCRTLDKDNFTHTCRFPACNIVPHSWATYRREGNKRYIMVQIHIVNFFFLNNYRSLLLVLLLSTNVHLVRMINIFS